MSIEAMRQALAALETCRIRSVSEWEVSDVTPKNITAAIAALRAAIQQAEAKTDVRCEGCGYMTHHREHMGCVRAAKQFTHPAPGVPDADFDLICNAIDKADTLTMEGDYMLDSDDCIAVVRVMQVLLSVRAAMLAT